MILKILIVLVASVASAVCYRMGGTSAGTKWRDVGVPVVATALLVYLINPGASWGLWLALLVHFGLLFGALTTYWKKKGDDATWLNWLLCGVGFSLAAFPVAWATGHWLGFAIRIFALTGLTVAWSVKISNDIAEEFGRGFLITATLPLLLL